MAGHPELLGLATGIVSAHIRNNAIARNSYQGLSSRSSTRLLPPNKRLLTAEGKTGSGRAAFRCSRSHCLPGLRKAFFNAGAAPDDRL